MTENLVRGGMTLAFSWLPAVIGFFFWATSELTRQTVTYISVEEEEQKNRSVTFETGEGTKKTNIESKISVK